MCPISGKFLEIAWVFLAPLPVDALDGGTVNPHSAARSYVWRKSRLQKGQSKGSIARALLPLHISDQLARIRFEITAITSSYLSIALHERVQSFFNFSHELSSALGVVVVMNIAKMPEIEWDIVAALSDSHRCAGQSARG